MTFYGSIEEYFEQYKPVKYLSFTQHDVEEKGLANLLAPFIEAQLGPLLVSVGDARILAMGVPGRNILYRMLSARNDREAYEKLVNAQTSSPAIVFERFDDYFDEKGVSLNKLAFKLFEHDRASYITSSIIIACSSGVCNASIHRIMVRENYTAVRVVPRHLYRMLREREDRGEALPVAIVVGAHPLILLAASTSPPYGVFELPLAASLAGKKLALCRTPLFSLPIPCGASFVFEALLGPKRVPEGPFVDVLGLGDRVREEPVLTVKAAYVNKVFSPYHYVIIPGSIEHMILMGFPREAEIYNAASKIAEVVKVRLTPSSGMWLHAIISVRRLREGEAVNVGLAAFAAHPSLKLAIIVDEDIDPDDPCNVEWAVATRVRWGRDIYVIRNARGSTLDPSGDDGIIDKIVIDATRPFNRDPSLFEYKLPFRIKCGRSGD